MRLYFAPMEGITNYIYRNAHRRYFPGIDRYYTPFIAPNHSQKLTTREMNDVRPENNTGIPLVPQILTNNSEYFLWCAEKLRELEYDEVNLNLGCPSGTVVSKGKGAGFLAFPYELDCFLEEIFAKCPIGISAKMRIGMHSADEFPALLELVRQYPFREIIFHPRTRDQLYGGTPNYACYRSALTGSPFPVSYNGDLFSVRQVQSFLAEYGDTYSLMLGRGFLANPGLCCMLKGMPMPEKESYRLFSQEILDTYLSLWHDSKAVICHMKEFWSYMISLFPDTQKFAKALKKVTDPMEYRALVDDLFAQKDLVPVEEWEFRRL